MRTAGKPKPTVLIVEDDGEVIKFLVAFYESRKYHVIVARTAEKAVRIVEQNRGRPMVALIDIGLPGDMDGVALILYITQYARHVACHVITGSSDIDLHRRAKWAGAVEVLVKPADDDDLERAVQSPLVARLVTDNILDEMTALQRRPVFEDVANGQILAARRQNQPLSLLFIDINDFKVINDTLGHKTGDRVLRRVAKIIRDNLRSYDHPCRWGGDEIVVLLPAVAKKRALEIAHDLREAVGKEVFKLKGGRSTILSISIGVTALGLGDRNIRSMVRRADKSMYTDKKQQKKVRVA